MLRQREQADVITNHFSVQRQRSRQAARPMLQPAAQNLGKGFRVHAREHLVKHTVAGHLPKRLGALLAREPQAAPLWLA